jgi:hypothetical protein
MTKLSYEELENHTAAAMQKVVPGSTWRHYKGGEYAIVTLAVQEEDQQLAVIYSPLAHPKIAFVRPLSMWDEQVEWEGKTVPRFAKFA